MNDGWRGNKTMSRLNHKVALVTGAASGIGRATALLFANEGAGLILSDINNEGLLHTEKECKSLDTKVISIVADVSKAEDCEKLVERGSQFFGALDAVVNIAGIGSFDKTVENTDESLWDKIIATNLKSVYLISKFSIPHMRKRGGGTIVNLSSPHAFMTGEGVAPYAASKGGVMALSRQMAFDLAQDGIRVNAVVPGATDTAMLRSQAEERGVTLEALGFYSDQKKLGRIAQPDEVAKGILWLVTDESSFVNASALFVDGGLTARL